MKRRTQINIDGKEHVAMVTIPTCVKCGLPNPSHEMFFNKKWLCEDCFELWKKVYGKLFLFREEAIETWERFIKRGDLFIFR